MPQSITEPHLVELEINYFYYIGMPLAILALIYFMYKKYIMKPLFIYLMKDVHSHLEKVKKDLFAEAISHINQNKNLRMNILEIGVGSGENFKYFPENSNVSILDNTNKFLNEIKNSYKERPDLEVSKLMVEKAEHMKDVESNSMDLVVHTFIMCSVENQDLVTKEIYRVLKPGGVCLFIEHSLENKFVSKFMKEVLNLIYWPIGLNCKQLDMNGILQNSKYDTISTKNYAINSWWYFRINPIVYGYGLKRVSK